ncbi:MAG: alcohol dehydrogenase catalytic domain-containing protein [archaeon]
MRAAVYYNNNDIRLEEREIPAISDGEILVKVRASGICGTDVMEWYRIKKAPRILGHEIAGEVADSRSLLFNAGDRVFVSHHVPCNKCKYCLDGNHTACETLHAGNYDPGGFSEYVRVPKINVENGTYKLGCLSFGEGAMIEPLACAVRGMRVAGVKKGQTILVLGSGVSGLLCMKVAKQLGARVVATDIDEYRLEKARQLGAEAFNARNKPDVTAERIIICTGAMQAVEQAFRCMDRKGVMLFFAIPKDNVKLPMVDFWRNEWTLMSSYGAASGDLEESLRLISEGRVDVKDLITHRLPLEKIQEGFRIVADAKDSLKVVLEL